MSLRLEEVTARTLADYDANAEAFWEGTRDHDVTQNYEAFLSRLPPGESRRLLDFGCGPGRDVLYFRDLGYAITGLDGSERFCEMARRLTGCPILHQNFLKLNLPDEEFEGIFANASLFHVPSSELPRVLSELAASLKRGGVLFTSNPRGNDEGWVGDRYGNFMEIDAFTRYLEGAGLELLHHYYRPQGKPRAHQPWLATVSRKP